jgi:hypothetical protein
LKVCGAPVSPLFDQNALGDQGVNLRIRKPGETSDLRGVFAEYGWLPCQTGPRTTEHDR